MQSLLLQDKPITTSTQTDGDNDDSSSGCLDGKVLRATNKNYHQCCGSSCCSSVSNNTPVVTIATAIHTAHMTYVNRYNATLSIPYRLSIASSSSSSCFGVCGGSGCDQLSVCGVVGLAVLFVVSDEENNEMDQRAIQTELQEANGVRCLRLSGNNMRQLYQTNRMVIIGDDETQTGEEDNKQQTNSSKIKTVQIIRQSYHKGNEGKVEGVSYVRDFHPGRLVILFGGDQRNSLLLFGFEISVVYFRAMYDPCDFVVGDTNKTTTNEKKEEEDVAVATTDEMNGIWSIRELLEWSHAAKCPSVAAQLSGTKKVQQMFSHNKDNHKDNNEDNDGKDVLKKLNFSKKEIEEMRKVFMSQVDLWETLQQRKKMFNDNIDKSNNNNDNKKKKKEGNEREGEGLVDIIAEAIANPNNFVLKPQREGGGNNIYGKDIANRLKNALLVINNENEDNNNNLKQYILMSKIKTPTHKAVLMSPWLFGTNNLRDVCPTLTAEQISSILAGNDVIQISEQRVLVGSGGVGRRLYCISVDDCVSELGVYGCMVMDGEKECLFNKQDGCYLLRTKSARQHEGGVAAGFAAIDSLLLV
eukprot:GHVS01019146.1.p1 GENE.GHVS01019146.1~~GHVS01019146.1.p1  ORF type:complete len:656 (-),score=166.84 GHVS01019146.1:176-1927(-)